MIQGFEEQTAPLSEAERAAVRYIIPLLSNARGKNNAVFNDQLASACPIGIRPNPARIRKIINYIRNTDLVPCLIASSKGYYVAEKESELREYEDSLDNRAKSILETRDSIKRQRLERFSGLKQGRLW